MDPIDEQALISANLVKFLRSNLKEGDEYEVAMHPVLRRVMVFRDDDMILNCSFEDLMAGPGGSLN